LIEALTYRRNPHTTSDDDGRYRSSAENDAWAALDPIDRLRLHLESNGQLTEEAHQGISDQSKSLAENLRSGCRSLPVPQPESSFENTYADIPSELQQQMSEHLEFVETGE
jgi:2-oxoisovalerate dehydrogenase E1 component alpha subunit